MSDISNCRVLVVDDTKADVDVLVETLRDSYKISVALDGENALRNVSRNKPDLILLDIMMPGLDGYEVAARLKDNPETADIPIIFISALTEEKDKTTAFAHGGVDYVTKPFEAYEVKARVRTHLQLRTAQQAKDEISRRIAEELKKPLGETMQVLRELIANPDPAELSDKLTRLLESIRAGHELCDELAAGHSSKG